ncbi:DNA polymerase IV [Corynebacterium anserum]
MDAFFASVEQLTRPTLRGRPVLVGGMSGRGVVAGASYEARVFGAHSAMPMSQAVRLCRNRAVVVRPRLEVYKVASRRIFEVIRAHAGAVVEQLSVDEGFAEPPQLIGATDEEARAWAMRLQRAVEEETGLPSSVGMASTKLDAKMASDLGKPHGIAVVSVWRRMQVFGPRPAKELWGIGKVAQARLAEVGVHTIAEFVKMDRADVKSLLGAAGVDIQRMAAGNDTRPVAPRARSKQMSAERTLTTNIHTSTELWPIVNEVAKEAHRRLLKDGRAARTITAKVRTEDFHIHTRSATLPAGTDDLETITVAARRVMPRPEQLGSIRLVGVGLSGLVDIRQELLFPELITPAEEVGMVITMSDSNDHTANGMGGLAPLNARASNSGPWQTTQDVEHEIYGHGWVQGTGSGVVSVRFETRATGPGKTKTFSVNDPALHPADPLASLAWDLRPEERSMD